MCVTKHNTLDLMDLMVNRWLVFCAYVAYLVLDAVSIYWAVDDLNHNYDRMFYILVITSSLHLALLAIGLAIESKCPLSLKGYRAYPFDNRLIVLVFVVTDVALLCATITVFVVRVQDTRNSTLLVFLLALATLSNLLCIFKFWYLQTASGVRSTLIHTEQEPITGDRQADRTEFEF